MSISPKTLFLACPVPAVVGKTDPTVRRGSLSVHPRQPVILADFADFSFDTTQQQWFRNGQPAAPNKTASRPGPAGLDFVQEHKFA